MEHEVELLRGRRARDIKALQSDKETLSAVYQRMMVDLRATPDALTGLDDGRKSALRRVAARLETAASGNAIALRTASEANHRLDRKSTSLNSTNQSATSKPISA